MSFRCIFNRLGIIKYRGRKNKGSTPLPYYLLNCCGFKSWPWNGQASDAYPIRGDTADADLQLPKRG